MMTRKLTRAVVATLALGPLWWGTFETCPTRGDPPAGQEKAKNVPEPYSPYKYVLPTDQAIRLFQDKVKRDPKDALSYTLLGQMYVRRARETGDFSCYDQADTAIRRALELDRDSISARATLAQVLCANHKFADGLKLAQEVYRKHPEEPHLLLIMGDAHLELGNYQEAEKAYQELQRQDPLAYLRSRQARLAELKGQTQEALRLMRQAAAEETGAALSKEARAWYPMRLGELCWSAGLLAAAARHYQAALGDHPKYAAALAGLGRVRAAQGNYGEAIDLYKRAVLNYGTLPMLAELGDLYVKTREPFLARLCYEKLERTGLQSEAYYRELSLYYSDHDLKPADALELAKKDLALRKDIYASDTLAWALYKNNRFEDAAKAMAEALRLGTQDANLYYHAGMIAYRLGQKAKAQDYLERGLKLNPHFSLRQASDAKRTLAALGGKGDPH